MSTSILLQSKHTFWLRKRTKDAFIREQYGIELTDVNDVQIGFLLIWKLLATFNKGWRKKTVPVKVTNYT